MNVDTRTFTGSWTLGENKPTKDVDTLLLSESIEEYVLECKIQGFTETTMNVKENILQRFISHTGDIPLKSVRTSHIKEYILHMVNVLGRKPITVNNNLRQIKALFNWCQGEELIKTNPFDKVKMLKQEKRLANTFTLEEIVRIIEGIKGKDFLSIRNKTILTMFVETGVRCSELINIKLTDVGDDIRILGKGNKVRYVPVSPVLQLQLRKYLRTRTTFIGTSKSDLLFPSRTKNKILRTSLVTSLKQYIGDNRTLHDLRRFYSQQMLSKVGIYHLSRLLGHSDIITTQRYVSGISDADILEQGKFNSPLTSL